MSRSSKPAERSRSAIASEAAVTLPTESVVLISINCFRISLASPSFSFKLCAAAPIGIHNTSGRNTERAIRDGIFFLLDRGFGTSGISFSWRKAERHRQRAPDPRSDERDREEKKNQAAEQKGEHVGTQHEESGVARMQHRPLHAPIHKIGALARPLVEPVEIVNRNKVKPDRPRGRNRMPPSGDKRQHHMQLVNTNQPIHPAHKAQEKEVE